MSLRKIAIVGGQRINITGADIEDERLCDFCEEILDPKNTLLIDASLAISGKPSRAFNVEIHLACLPQIQHHMYPVIHPEPPF